MNPGQAIAFPLIAFGLTEFFMRRGATAKRLKTTAADRGTTLLIFASYALVVVLLFWRNLPGRIIPSTVEWIGVGVSVAGLLLRWWAITVLGRFYTRTLTTTGDQMVVSRGPYRMVRHPGYLGSLMTWLGAATATGNALVLGSVAVLLLIAYVRRINAEEAMLAEKLGTPYAAYRQRTWQLLPFIF